MDFNDPKTCRVCLKQSDLVHSVWDHLGDRQIADIIRNFLGIEVSDDLESANLQYICCSCIQVLEKANNLRRTASKNDSILKRKYCQSPPGNHQTLNGNIPMVTQNILFPQQNASNLQWVAQSFYPGLVGFVPAHQVEFTSRNNVSPRMINYETNSHGVGGSVNNHFNYIQNPLVQNRATENLGLLSHQNSGSTLSLRDFDFRNKDAYEDDNEIAYCITLGKNNPTAKCQSTEVKCAIHKAKSLP